MYLVIEYFRDLIQFGESKTGIIFHLMVTIGIGIISYFLILVVSKFPFSLEKPLLFERIENNPNCD